MNGMNREFLINIAFLVVINLLIKPFYLFGIDRTVQNTVGPGEYGLYFALFNFTLLFQIINDPGLQHFNNRSIAQNRRLLDRFLPNMLVLKGLLSLLFLLAVAVAAWWSGYRGSGYYRLLGLLVGNQILTSLLLFVRSNLSGLGLYRTDSLLSVLDRLLVIALCGALLLTPASRAAFRIEWFVLTQTAALALSTLAAILLLYRRAGRLRFRWRPAMLALILRRSLPYALVIFLMTVYTRIDGVMIERLLPDGAVEAGRYAAAYRLLDASNMIGFLFAGLLFPMFARLLREREPVAPLLHLGFQVIWAGAGALATATFFFRREIMAALYTEGDAYSAQILGLLMISFLAVSGSYIYGTLLGAHGSLRVMNAAALAGVALNVALNLWLIPRRGAPGAAAATCLTQFLVFFAQVALVHRQLKVPTPPSLILRAVAFLVLAAALNFALARYEAGPWPVRYATGLGAALLLAPALRLANPGDFRRLF